MQCLVSIRYEGDEHREDNVDEEANEDVQVDLAEDIGRGGGLRHPLVCGKHVIAVDQREQAVGRHKRILELWKKWNVSVHT